MKRNIVLTGFMGTGKTSTGKNLSQKLGRSFIDLDHYIEEKYQMKIPDMFSRFGEEYFRTREKEIVDEVSSKHGIIIATGGGTVKDPWNIARLRENGIIVCLTSNIETISTRTEHRGDRPVLDREEKSNRDRIIAIERLLQERKKFYDQCDVTVDTSDKSPMQVVEEICRYLKARGV